MYKHVAFNYFMVMRISVLIFLFGITLGAFGQASHTKKAANFINGVNYGAYLPYFNQTLIDSVTISKHYVDKENDLFGAIYLTTKTPNKFNFLSINDIDNAYKIEKSGLTLYMLNKEFIKEAAHFKIDSSYIYKVEVIKGKDFDYLKNSQPNLSIVKIFTNTKENWPSSVLKIRGDGSKED